MKKIASIITLIVTLFLSSLLAKTSYNIQLASAQKNELGLKHLKSDIKLLPPKLQENLQIITGENYHILYTNRFNTKQDAMDNLDKYKLYFKDAIIRKYYQDRQKIEQNSFFTNEMLVGKTIFALYIDKKRKGAALITMHLNPDLSMKFDVSIGKKDSGFGKYFIDFQGRFYIYMHESERYSAYYTLKKITPNYLLVEAWENSEKDSNEIRFYTDYDKALSYFNSLTII